MQAATGARRKAGHREGGGKAGRQRQHTRRKAAYHGEGEGIGRQPQHAT